MAGPLLYYITDRNAFPGDEAARRRRLLEKIAEAARARVDYIQLREKDLSARELEILAREAVAVIERLRAGIRELSTALLINSRTDVAMAAGADGVHLRSNDISPQEAREIWEGAELPTLRKLSLDSAPDRLRQPGEISRLGPVIGVSCHSSDEVARTGAQGANFAVFAPVFGKKDTQGSEVPAAGLAQLKEACKSNIPVLALGGVNLANARSCLEAGAAGIAAVRLFQENEIGEVVKRFRV
jgi:thiamine-phosphate pyrophosphorylase